MIFLKPMNFDEHFVYMSKMVPDYAAEVAKNRNISYAEAKTIADKQIIEMIPDGLSSANNYFYLISAEGTSAPLGYLWFFVKTKDGTKVLYIADIIVDEAHRGKQIGTRVLGLVDKYAKDFACNSIELHVFGHNTGARKLYEALGYEATNIYMRKVIQ